MAQFPTLYKKSATGALQYWSIGTEANVIVTRWGQVGGAEQETRDVVKSGKNIGKKNETTASEQAALEAQAKWEKQLKKGYVRTEAEAMAGKVDAIIEGGIAPMLAHKFSEQAQKIVYPALAQPKLDGHRCIAVVANGKATLWTRTRKPITGVPHIVADIERLAAERGISNIILDGELYNHSYRDNFETLSSFVRTAEPKPGAEIVQYHVYDLAADGLPQGLRIAELNRFFGPEDQAGSLVRVETRQVASKEELDEAFAEFMEAGYEGLMVRNIKGLYVHKRSYDLQKVKEFDDAEFVVTGVEEGRGKLAGKAIFVCEHEGRQFRCKMKGRTEDLAKFVQNPSLAIGKKLTVRYFGMSHTNQVPRFPVGVRFRED
jgi:ATP-dependent DNA ligase